jgi:hypothetical protein
MPTLRLPVVDLVGKVFFVGVLDEAGSEVEGETSFQEPD